jgi:hypothetical protein
MFGVDFLWEWGRGRGEGGGKGVREKWEKKKKEWHPSTYSRRKKNLRGGKICQYKYS